MKRWFGTDGIRGRVNDEPMTVEIATRVGMAIAATLSRDSDQHNRRKVYIGRDTRSSGKMLESALISGLTAAGWDCVILGVLPTPAVAWLTMQDQAAAGVMITASHNPFEDNGIKIFGSDGYKLIDEQEFAIEKWLHDGDAAAVRVDPSQLGSITEMPDAAQRYAQCAKASLTGISLDGIKIILDCGHGAASHIGPEIFRDLGAEVISLAANPDGKNINDQCGAVHPERAAAAVLEHQADLAICFDGDADRVIFCDAFGKVVSGDCILALCAMGLHAQKKLRHDTLVVTVMSNLGLDEAMKKSGIRVERTAVGDRHVLQRMRQDGLAFGGENSGHLIFADYATTGDGIMSALQILRLMLSRNASLAELADVIEQYPQQLLNLKVKSKPDLSTLTELQSYIAAADQELADHGRQLIRYSGTEAKIRILVEHRDLAVVEKWVALFSGAIEREIGLA